MHGIPICAARNFNSHAHVERDSLAVMPTTISSISTHTLTWSVTKSKDIAHICTNISTHTLTWSVTVPLYQFISSLWISTHTLTWSVTDIFQP